MRVAIKDKALMSFGIIPEGAFYSEFTEKQCGAVILAIRLGKDAQDMFPAMADDYRNGFSARKIVEKYKIKEIFGVEEGVARTIVYNALGGYEGNFVSSKHRAYPGLIEDKEEFKRLAKRNNSESGRKSGLKQFKLKKGIHAQTPRDRLELGSFITIAKGRVPYTEEEFLDIYKLAHTPEFKMGTRIKAEKIAKAVNNKYHKGEEVRNSDKITKAFMRIKRYIEQGILTVE